MSNESAASKPNHEIVNHLQELEVNANHLQEIAKQLQQLQDFPTLSDFSEIHRNVELDFNIDNDKTCKMTVTQSSGSMSATACAKIDEIFIDSPILKSCVVFVGIMNEAAYHGAGSGAYVGATTAGHLFDMLADMTCSAPMGSAQSNVRRSGSGDMSLSTSSETKFWCLQTVVDTVQQRYAALGRTGRDFSSKLAWLDSHRINA